MKGETADKPVVSPFFALGEEQMMQVGQLQYFQSKVDGKLHPCAVCATDTSDEPKPLNCRGQSRRIGESARRGRVDRTDCRDCC